MENTIAELMAIYSKIAEAFRNKDLDGIAKYIAPDWTGSHGGEGVTREQLLENVCGQFQTLDEISWPRTIYDARMDGAGVTVRAEGTFSAVKRDSREPLRMELANDDTWRKGPDGWQNIHSKGLGA